MNFLRKILLIAVVAVFADNAEGMTSVNGIITALPQIIAQMHTPAHNQEQLDFNSIANNGSNIPSSYQPKIYRNPTIGAPNTACVYFTITNNGNPNNPNNPFQNAAVVNPAPANECNIYFPMDGRQPTTPEAVSWSCANIDNRPDSPITEWYMQMFGVIPFNANNYIKAGWSVPALGNGAINAQRIISFDTNCAGFPHDQCSVVNDGNTHIVDDPSVPGAQISRRALFEREFRKIASTSVGRVLLYRILIEVRRHTANNVGTTENQTFVGNTVGIQNDDRCRSIEIAYDGEGVLGGFGFSDMDRKIIFANNPNIIANIQMRFSVIGRSRKEGYTHIVHAPIELDVAIFHEMVHWFHHLRNPKRNYIEINSDRSKHFNDISLSRYYWKNIDNCFQAWALTKEQNYARFWSTGMPSHINFEEMRTLLGMPHNILDAEYLNGDDLSENLYRSCKGMLLRFGYNGDNFYEDRKVINRVINAIINNYIVYITGRDSWVSFSYNRGRSGFGKCKVFP